MARGCGEMTEGKIRCKVDKVDEGKYRVLRLVDGEWRVWLENKQHDWRENSWWNAYYPTPADAKKAAAEEAAKERNESKDSEEFEV